MKTIEHDSTCEILYKLRDAVAADELIFAMYLVGQLQEKLTRLINSQEHKGCILNCGSK